MDKNKKSPATQETRDALYENMGKTISELSPVLREYMDIKKHIYEDDTVINFKIYDAFLSLCIYSKHTIIELASVLRASFRADLPAEKRYNIKWINCVILEAYKYLYGYGSKRKKSLWMTVVKPALNIDRDPELAKDFNALEIQIKEFGQNQITNKDSRDLSFHYDLEPVSVYNMLMKLSEEEEVQRLINFMGLVEKILSFTSKHISKYCVIATNDHSRSREFSFSLFELDIFGDKKALLLSGSEKVIQDNSIRLSEFCRHQNIPNRMLQHFKGIDKKSMDPIYRLTEMEKVAMQLSFLYIDLASAIRAFLTAEYPIEKQLSLKQVNVIIYEGINKIYNLNEESLDSFWSMYISPILPLIKDASMLRKFNSFHNELKEFKSKTLYYKNQRQLSVHLTEGIEEVYSMLDNMNPFEELKKALDTFNFLPKLLDFLTMCLKVVGENSQIAHEQKMAPTYEKIDEIIQLLKKTPDSEQKEDLIRKLEDIKSGKFFEELMRKKRN
ncbi:MAG: hypothetical protein PHY15_06235 [Eubacteriales bacterium]|nr:hypothetical protein [Eubacteriales bacterium]